MGTQATTSHATRIAALGTAAAIAFTAFGTTSAHADERHKVAPGDTVSALAHRYGSTIDAIIATNRLNSRATIYSGVTITIPTTTSKSASTTSARTASVTTTHKVVSGDTVWDISRAYKTTVSGIIKANGLGNSAIIRVGQTLTIPGASGAKTVASTQTSTKKSGGSTQSATTTSTRPAGTHKVASGDTVWAIAVKYGTSVAAIINANDLGKAATIRIGQSLVIPGAKASSSSSGSTTASGTPKLATDKNLGEFSDVPSGLVGDSFLGRTYSAPVVGAANQNKATLKSMDVPSKAQMQALIVDTARKMGVDPALAQAVAYQESGFNMRAVSPANAIGVMQVIPSSGEWASEIVGRDLNLLIPTDNVTAGVAILKRLQRNGTSLSDAIGGYYQGETAVRKYGLYSDTKRYVASVRMLMTRFS